MRRPHLLDALRDQVLLCAVVQVALQPSPCLVLRRNQPLPRGAQLVEALQQLGGEADVLEHQPSLVGEVLDQFLLDRRERLTAALGDCQRSQKIPLMQHRHGSLDAVDLRKTGLDE